LASELLPNLSNPFFFSPAVEIFSVASGFKRRSLGATLQDAVPPSLDMSATLGRLIFFKTRQTQMFEQLACLNNSFTNLTGQLGQLLTGRPCIQCPATALF
jgi:hypothetical protein